MKDEYIVREMGQIKPKGILKGENTEQERDTMVIEDDLRGLVHDMKQMLDGDLAQKA